MEENIYAEKDEIDFEKYSHIQTSTELNEEDRILIITQCENQNATSDEQIKGFMEAYKEAKMFAIETENLKKLDKQKVLELILHWAELIEPQNAKGWRNTPVTFQNGDHGVEHSQIQRQMDLFAEEFANPSELTTSEELYVFFEKVHPLEDGNGRLGDLLWKLDITRKTGTWPNTLAPKKF